MEEEHIYYYLRGYLRLGGLVCASSSWRGSRWLATTSPDRAACAAGARVAPTHSTWPAPRGPARATKQEHLSHLYRWRFSKRKKDRKQ